MPLLPLEDCAAWGSCTLTARLPGTQTSAVRYLTRQESTAGGLGNSLLLRARSIETKGAHSADVKGCDIGGREKEKQE